MRAVQVYEGGELRHETVADPVAAPGEVVVELRAATLAEALTLAGIDRPARGR